MNEFLVKNEEDTRAFGITLAESLKASDVIGLIGDLGTGKTTLTKYIAEGLGIDETITSPTFTVVKEYNSGRLPLYHFDVYRLTSGNDLWEIGADDYLYGKGVSIVEWADLVKDGLPENTKFIYLEYGKGQNERIYKWDF
ncbi:tRNA threonylcarbamoyladenosine biosynthesis protein TsaE [Peptostreptococcaceae bacterium pGA-8]|nr:tRNA threonylcarbamoyladenosine biosynthesis protein TsaE [Peptostreptococcaceae bacterium pGA-8]